MNKVLIFGSSGFIGSKTIEELSSKGFDVLGCDIREPWKSDRFSAHDFLNCDITNHAEVMRVVKLFKPSFIYNFAAIIRPVDCELASLNSCDVNVKGLYNILECCKNLKGFERLFFPSTVHIYQSNSMNEDEQTSLKNVPHLYPSTKLVGEQIIKSYNLLFDIPYTIFRYGVAYGPGGHEDGVVMSFVRNILRSKKISLRGNNSRSFLNVRDHVRANILALSSEAKNQTFNLDGGEKIKMRDLISIIEEICGKKAELEILPVRQNDYKGVKVCNEKIKERLGWEPSITLRQGITELIKIYNER